MTVPDFGELDPELARAEAALADGGPLAGVRCALPDETAAARFLNAVLADSGATPRLRRHAAGWRIVTLSVAAGAGDLAATASGLANLVAADGWRRVKQCARPGCATAFIDRTNGVTRRYCRDHSRHEIPRGQTKP